MSRMRTGVALAALALGGADAAMRRGPGRHGGSVEVPGAAGLFAAAADAHGAAQRPGRAGHGGPRAAARQRVRALPDRVAPRAGRQGRRGEPDRIADAQRAAPQALAPEALDRYLEGRAASIETSIGDDAGSAGMSVLKQDFARGAAGVLRRPAPAAVRPGASRGRQARHRGRHRPAERRSRTRSPSREFRELMYGGDTPFARQVTYATLQGLTRDDLVAWHAKYLHPGPDHPRGARRHHVGGSGGGGHQGVRHLGARPEAGDHVPGAAAAVGPRRVRGRQERRRAVLDPRRPHGHAEEHPSRLLPGAGAQRGAERQLHVAAVLERAHRQGARLLGRRRCRQQLHARRAVLDEHQHEDGDDGRDDRDADRGSEADHRRAADRRRDSTAPSSRSSTRSSSTPPPPSRCSGSR